MVLTITLFRRGIKLEYKVFQAQFSACNCPKYLYQAPKNMRIGSSHKMDFHATRMHSTQRQTLHSPEADTPGPEADIPPDPEADVPQAQRQTSPQTRRQTPMDPEADTPPSPPCEQNHRQVYKLCLSATTVGDGKY